MIDIACFGLFIAVVRAHVNLDGVNVNKTESELVTKITNLLIDSSIDQRNRILELVNNKVIAVKPGQSIVLYIYCKTIEYLQELEESLTSRQLKDSVEVWFNDLLHRSDRIIVTTITVSDDEFQRMRKNFKGQNLFPNLFITMCLVYVVDLLYVKKS